jgi:phosphoesterase RecJ-like protein
MIKRFCLAAGFCERSQKPAAKQEFAAQLYSGKALATTERNIMPVDWSLFVKMIQAHRRFLLTTHVRPDGDGLGSILALAETLEAHGKQCDLLITSVFPPRYTFLDPKHRIARFTPPGDQWRNTEAVLILDTGTWNQLDAFGPFLRSLSVPKAVIDHHQTQDDLGAAQFIDVTAEATGRLTYEAICALNYPLTPQVASHLFVALAMDTGWFRHANTTPATFELASELVSAGARPELLYDELFERNSLPRLKLMGLVLDRLQVTENGRVAYSEVRPGDYELTKATPQDTEDLVNFTRSVAGVEVGLLFMEQPRGGVKVSFRSRSIDVARIAERFGGGGHRLAAGATLQASLDEARARVLDAVRAAFHAPSFLPA